MYCNLDEEDSEEKWELLEVMVDLLGGDYTKDELNKFLQSLDSKAYKKINDFFDSMPRLKQDVVIENPKTKVKTELTLSGLNDFFVSPSLTNR